MTTLETAPTALPPMDLEENFAKGAPSPRGKKAQAGEQAQGKLYNNGTIRVLVIDDDPSIGRLIRAALLQHEFVVDVVSEPSKVQAQLQKGEYHLIILDYVLPGLPIQQVLDWLQNFQADAGIIAITAYPSMDSALQCLRAHTFDYLAKPFPVESLQRSVIRCLESRGLLRLSEEALRTQLGATIRERRKALGLTLAEMARRSSVSLGYLSQIELGKNSASIETLYRIALALQMRVADLFQSLQTPL